MKLLYPLLFGVTLMAAACGKDSPEPAAPELLGRWNAQGSTGFTYDAAGKLQQEYKVIDQSFYLEIKKDSLFYRNIQDGRSQGSHAYSRRGSIITYGRSGAQINIITLDEHHLTLRYPDPTRQAGSPYQDVEEYYTRP